MICVDNFILYYNILKYELHIIIFYCINNSLCMRIYVYVQFIKIRKYWQYSNYLSQNRIYSNSNYYPSIYM